MPSPINESKEIKNEQEINDFKERISNFVFKFLISEYTPRENINSKVIHDPIWGTKLFYPWEIIIIDSPLFQRLRRIHQTGTAFFTYPSATHNRFAHSLGVCVLADKLLNQLKDKPEVANRDLINKKDIYEVRLAGLLHDIGHCFFSHTSEQVFELLEIFKLLKDKYPILRRTDCHPHEIFAYFILCDINFENFWTNFIKPFFENNKEHEPSLATIAQYVIGHPPSPEKRFLKEIITGPYDADKLEYLYRDGYVSGINITYDIERFFYKISVENTETFSKVKDENRLVMDLGGITAVEQLIFSKMMLHSYIYHHQKVRAADCLIRDIVYVILSEDSPFKIEHPCDFLNYTDYDLLTTTISSEHKNEISYLLTRLRNREFNFRCFVICKDFVEGIEADNEIGRNYSTLTGDMRDILGKQMEMRKELQRLINGKTGKDFNLYDIHIDLPQIPPLEEASAAPVKKPNGEIEPISEYFQFKGWQETYELKKLRGHFFVKENINESSEVVIRYISDKYSLHFSELALQCAKIINIYSAYYYYRRKLRE